MSGLGIWDLLHKSIENNRNEAMSGLHCFLVTSVINSLLLDQEYNIPFIS